MYDSEFKFEYDLLDQFQNNLNTHIEQFDVLFKQYVETSKIVKRYKSRTNPTKADENIAIESFKFFNPTVSLESMDMIHIEGFLDNIKQALTTVIEKIQENVKKVKTVMSNVGASVEHFCKGYDLRFLDYENKIQKVLSHENIKVDNSITEYYVKSFPLFVRFNKNNISKILEDTKYEWVEIFEPITLSLQDTLNIIKKKEYNYSSDLGDIQENVNTLLKGAKKCILITNIHKYNVTVLAADNDGNITRETFVVDSNKKYIEECLDAVKKEEQYISKDILEPLIRTIRTELLPYLSKLKQTIDKYYSEIFTSLDKEKRDIEHDDDIENNEDVYKNRIKSLKGLSNQWKLDLVHFSSYFIKTMDHFFNMITSNVEENNENKIYKIMIERIKKEFGKELPNAHIGYLNNNKKLPYIDFGKEYLNFAVNKDNILESLDAAFAISKGYKPQTGRIMFRLEKIDKNFISESEDENGLIFLNDTLVNEFYSGYKSFIYFHEMWHVVGQSEITGVKPISQMLEQLDKLNFKIVGELGAEIANAAKIVDLNNLEKYFDYIFSSDYDPDFMPITIGTYKFEDSDLEHYDKYYKDETSQQNLDEKWDEEAFYKEHLIKGGKKLKKSERTKEIEERIIQYLLIPHLNSAYEYFVSKTEIMPDAFSGAVNGYSYDQITDIRFKLQESHKFSDSLKKHGMNPDYLIPFFKSIYKKTLKDCMPEVLPYVGKLGKKLGFLDQLKMNYKNFINKNK